MKFSFSCIVVAFLVTATQFSSTFAGSPVGSPEITIDVLDNDKESSSGADFDFPKSSPSVTPINLLMDFVFNTAPPAVRSDFTQVQAPTPGVRLALGPATRGAEPGANLTLGLASTALFCIPSGKVHRTGV
jgi:hypothetical protein